MKYVKQFMLLLILCFCVHSQLSAQGIRKVINKCQYQEQLYKYQDMEDIFSKMRELTTILFRQTKNQGQEKHGELFLFQVLD